MRTRESAWAAKVAALAWVLVFACSSDGDLSANTEASTSDFEAETDFEPTHVRGLSIDEIELNQGTRIPIGVGGDWVESDVRIGSLIASRDSLMRVHYSVADGWVPRQIEARLTLGFPDGTSKSVSQLEWVAGASTRATLDGNFWFKLSADAGETGVGTTYQVELWETLARGGEGLDPGLPANPAAGPKLIGFEDVPLRIDLMLVPIEYGGVVPDLSDTIQARIVDGLYEQNPAVEIRWDVHAPVAYGGNLNNLGSLLPVISQLRVAEDAAPNVYYHALIDVGASALGGVYGISQVASDAKADSVNRVSATVLWSINPSSGVETFVHETGHAQGLAHVECPNTDAAAPDLAYPHVDGRIGNWGFGVRGWRSYDPGQAFDYMSYCGPTWVSDWTWNKTYARIKTLTAWDFEGPAGPTEPLELVLMGAIYADGSREWWTVPGVIDPERISGRDRFEFETLDGQIIGGFAERTTLSDGETEWVKVALPTAPPGLRAATYVRGDRLERIVIPYTDHAPHQRGPDRRPPPRARRGHSGSPG